MHDISGIIRATILAEAASGWALVRRVPSTHTWKTLDYMATLADDERQALLEAVERNALFFFEPAPAADTHAAQWPAFRRYQNAMIEMTGWEYLSAHMLHMALGEAGGRKPSRTVSRMPPEVLERAAEIQPASAAEIRRAVKASLTERFGAEAKNLGSGEWLYMGSWEGLPFELSIDYGGMYHQLRYEVTYSDPPTGMRAKRVAYERLVGAGHGHWDFLTADNLETSAELLCELVQRLLGLPKLIDAGVA